MMNDFSISRDEAMKHLNSGTEKLLANHDECKHSPEYESGWYNAFFGVQDIIHEILNTKPSEDTPITKPSRVVVLVRRACPMEEEWEEDEADKQTETEPADKKDSSSINHPRYYNTGKIEVIDFLEDQNLPFHLANAVKYICRAGKKEPRKTAEDLKKAVWYINRYINLVLDTTKPEVNRHD